MYPLPSLSLSSSPASACSNMASKPLSSTAEEYIPYSGAGAMSPPVGLYLTAPVSSAYYCYSMKQQQQQYFPGCHYYYYPYPYSYYMINTTPPPTTTPYSCNAGFVVTKQTQSTQTQTETKTPSEKELVDLKSPAGRSRGRKIMWVPRGGGINSDPPKTTLMIRNIPNLIRRQELMEFLKKRCCGQEFDFVYLPMDFRKHKNLGYAFVNFTSEAAAASVINLLHNWKWTPLYSSSKVCKIDWARIQGKDALVRRFINTYFHCSDTEYLPVVLSSTKFDFLTVGRCAAAAKNVRFRARRPRV